MHLLTDNVFICDNFLSDDECANYINMINNLSTDQILNFTSDVNDYTNKQPYNAVIKCPNIAADLISRYQRYDNINMLSVRGINPYITFAKYNHGHKFDLHTDTGVIDHERKLMTGYVLLIYLNDNFSSGETIFYNDMFRQIATVKPKTGRAVIFHINTLHKGAPVDCAQDGHSKYWIGADIMIDLDRDIEALKYK